VVNEERSQSYDCCIRGAKILHCSTSVLGVVCRFAISTLATTVICEQGLDDSMSLVSAEEGNLGSERSNLTGNHVAKFFNALSASVAAYITLEHCQSSITAQFSTACDLSSDGSSVQD
jgi:hypothetical protein